MFNNKSILITGGTGSFGKKCAEVLLKKYKLKKLIIYSRDEGKQALIFGNEARGLTNEQLSLCTIGLHIPSNQEYTSLNIASSVQVVLYELLFESKYDAFYLKYEVFHDKSMNLFIFVKE